MNATEQGRLAERHQLVDRSITLHGGPYGGCSECHDAEERTRQALSLGPKDWQEQAAAWHRHLALD